MRSLVIKLPFRQHRLYSIYICIYSVPRGLGRRVVVVDAVRTLLQPSIRQRAARLTTFCIGLHQSRIRCHVHDAHTIPHTLLRRVTRRKIVNLFLRRRFSSDYLAFICVQSSLLSFRANIVLALRVGIFFSISVVLSRLCIFSRHIVLLYLSEIVYRQLPFCTINVYKT